MSASPRNPFHFKVGLFALISLALGAAFIAYLLHARGFFESTHRLQLAAASADGIAPGVPLVLSGIEIGKVVALGLNDSGGIIIRLELLERHAKWLRQDSRFVLDKPLVGSARIRLESGRLDAPPLADNATMLLLTPDIGKEIPQLVERVKAILANVEQLTRKDGKLDATLANVQTLSGRMAGEHGMLEGVFGSPEKARAVSDTLDRTRALIVRLDQLTAKLDGMAGKTDRWLFAPDGAADNAGASLAQVRRMLTDAQSSLKKADALLDNALAVSADFKAGTQDIAALRAEIDEAVRRANALIQDINQKWPFAREPEVRLP